MLDRFYVLRFKCNLQGREIENKNLPFGEEQSRNEIDGRGVPKSPLQDREHSNEDKDDNERRKR